MREPNDDEALFLRFRREGDPGALALVFDRTAPELLRIARHVAANPQESEDLLQATFLTALEKADRFEEGRRLRPWLVGILVRHAHAARRRGSRSLEVERVVGASPRDPRSMAEEREFEEQVERALDELPAHVREIVEPRVREGARGPEIARRVGRPPDTVRVQLSRGLSLLRGLLPSGLAGGLLLTASARESLAAVRRRVLEHATASGAATPLPSAGLLAFGGFLVMNKILVGVGAIALVVVAAGLLWSDGGEPDPVSPVEREVAAPSVAAPDPRAEIERSAVSAAAPSAAGSDRAVDGEPGPSAAAETAGVTGRLLLNGSPLAATEVTLVRVRVEEFTGSMNFERLRSSPSPFVELGRTITDARGEFTISGAPTWSVLALGVDLGGPSATLRLVEATLEPEVTRALGDLELGPVTAISGTVVDEDEQPVAGASVRAVVSPIPLAAVGAQHLSSDVLVLRPDAAAPERAVPLPAWAATWWNRLPVPTTTTGADGRFVLTGVSRGVVSLVVRKEGRVPHARSLATGVAPVREIGVVALESGRTFGGRVVDAEGAPVAGVETYTGLHSALAGLTFARPTAATAADGRFRVTGLPEVGDVVVALRRDGRDDWTVVRVGDEEEAELRLASRAALTVELIGDVPAPEEGFEISAVRAEAPWSIERAAGPRHVATADGAGRFVFPDLAVGSYAVLVAFDGVASATRVDVPSEGGTITAELPRASTVRVRVVDDATDAPVGGATVLLQGRVVATDVPVEGVTAADGSLSLGPIAAAGSEGGSSVVPRLKVVCSHPRYGRVEESLRDGPDEVVELRLSSPGSVEGRISIAGDPPPTPLLVMVFEDDGFLGFLRGAPSFATTTPRGTFTVPVLAPGAYRYEVRPRFLAGDGVASIPLMASPPDSIAKGDFVVRPGETTDIQIEAVTAESAVACRVVGRVTRDGRPLEGARVYVHPRGRFADSGARTGSGDTDATGAFDIAGLPPGEARVDVSLFERTPTRMSSEQVYSRVFDLGLGGVTRVDVALESHWLDLLVVDAAGAPVYGAELTLAGEGGASEGVSGQTRTDKAGKVRMEARASGRFRLDAFHQRFGAAEVVVTVPREEPLTVVLEVGVPCRGRFTVPLEWVPEGGWFPYIEFAFTQRGRTERRQVLVFPEGDGGTFDVRGIPAGEIELRFLHQNRASRPVRLLLPPGGAEALEADFEAE